MLRNHLGRDSIVALLTLLLSACSSAPEPAPVQQVSEALGGFTELWNGVNGETPLFVNTTWSAFKHVSAGCDRIDAYDIVHGGAIAVGALPTCGTVSAAGGDGTLFVAVGQSIYAMVPPAMGMAGSGAGGSTWQLVTNTTGTSISKIVTDASRLYWQDSLGIHRVPRGGGSITNLASGRLLLAVDGTKLYVQSDDGGGQYSLRSIDSSTGGAESVIAHRGAPFSPGFSLEPGFALCVQNGVAGDTNRILRVSLTDGSIVVTKSSTTLTYYLPIKVGSMLYYFDKSVSSGVVTMRRLDFSNGILASAPTSYVDVVGMAIGTSAYFTAKTAASPARYGLERGAL